MTVTAQSADGVQHQFPDGTDPAVIDRVMKSYATGGQSTPATAPQGNADLGSMSGQAMDQMTGGLSQKANAGLLGLIQGGIVDPAMGRGFNVGGRYNDVLNMQRNNQAAYNTQNPGKAALGNAMGVGAGLMLMPSIGTGVKGAAMTGAAYGGLLGAAQDGGTVQEHVKNAGIGAAAGGAGGFALGLAAKGIGKLITPFMVPAENAAAADILKNAGVDVSAGQKTGSDWLKYRESMLGSQSFNETQASQFTKAALAKVGENADRALPEVMQNIDSRIGGQFEKLAANTAIVPDATNGFKNWHGLADDVNQTVADYVANTGQSALPRVTQKAQDILDKMKAGQIDGSAYKSIRSDLSRFSAQTSQPEAKMAARGLIDALDTGMGNSLDPSMKGAWNSVRNDYRNFLVLQRASTGAGSDAAKGIISPSALRNATVNVQGRKNYAFGKGDFANLARAGETVLKPLPNSGTAQRLSALAPSGLGALLGGAYGAHHDGIWGGAIGAGVGAMAGRELLGRLLMSRTGQAYLANQLVQGGPLLGQLETATGKVGGLLGYDAYSAFSH